MVASIPLLIHVVRGETIIAGDHLDAGSISWEVVFLPADKLFYSVKNVFIWNSSRQASRETISDRDPSYLRKSWKHVVRSNFAALHFSACAVFSWGCVETNGWPQYSFFRIVLDCIPCITIVHDELYVLHQECKTRPPEHSNRLGTASVRNSSSFRACWAGLGKGRTSSFCL